MGARGPKPTQLCGTVAAARRHERRGQNTVVDICQELLLNQGMANARTNTIDLNTAEGCAAWAKTLPTANLREIASRPIVRGNVHMVFAADLELFVRGEA